MPRLTHTALHNVVRESNISSPDIQLALANLTEYIESQDYAGYDPYDALNSPLIRLLSFGRKWPRIAAIQAMKRSPINFRPVLGIKPGHNPKGLGLFLWGYAKLYAIDQDEQHLDKISYLLNLLESLRSDCTGNGWGYNFDWQSRAFFVPKFTPTIVNSSFIGHALLDTYKYTGDERALDLALPIRDFILTDLHRTPGEVGACFSYTPIDRTIVHNANLLGASLLARLDAIDPHAESRQAALDGLAYTMHLQHDDGSWWYADTDYQQWIDSFHTGFNLQCIRYFLDLGLVPEYREPFHRGVEFYVNNFFEPDGTAKYFHNRTYPLDIPSSAQAIVVLSSHHAPRDEAPTIDSPTPNQPPSQYTLKTSILQNLLTNFQSARGHFYFQNRGTHTIKIPYIRWSQSWAFHALTSYALHSSHHAPRDEAPAEALTHPC